METRKYDEGETSIMRKIWIGVDVGLNGAFAAIGATDIPYVFRFKDATEDDIADAFKRFAPESIGTTVEVIAMLENVHSSPQMGVSSSFKFGCGFGVLKGILAAYKIKRDFVTPQKWQKELGCLSGGDKNKTKSKAQQLFPQIKVVHGNADALLICEYARRTRP